MTSLLQVQGTNDSSTVSKLSCCQAGYWNDPFLPEFVTKPARRAPLIHWGYFIRHVAVSHVIHTFLAGCEDHCTQVVCLGAGFDTTYFQLTSTGKLNHCRYFEVDLPQVIEKKRRMVEISPKITRLMDSVNGHYQLLACDIIQTRMLEKQLEERGIQWDIPTLLLAEVVLTYIDPAGVDSLVSWAAKRFVNAVFCSYEQVYPNDGFGKVMRKHFESLSSPLLNIKHFPSPERIGERYKHLGWQLVVAADMNTFYWQVASHEWAGVHYLEPFDEYEGWHLKCGHYVMVCALLGKCTALQPALHLPEQWPQVKASQAAHASLPVCQGTTQPRGQSLRRFAHGSVLLPGGEILVYGGFGCRLGSEAHSRLDDLLIVSQLGVGDEREWVVESPSVTGDSPGKVMHHTLTLLPNGSVLLLGGRFSPHKPNSWAYLLTKRGEHWHWEKKAVHGAGDGALARWRHSCTVVGDKDEVLVVGGMGQRGTVMDDMLLLDTHSWKCDQLPILMGVARHSHSAVSCNGSIVVAGGMDVDMCPLSSIFLVKREEGRWEMETFAIKIPARYSASLHCIRSQQLIMVGGVQLDCSWQPGIVAVDLQTRTSLEYSLQVPPDVTLLLHCFTAHWLPWQQELVLLGGGGNCFSFGTHLNCTPLVISLAQVAMQAT